MRQQEFIGFCYFFVKISTKIVNDKAECVLDTKENWKIEKYGEYNLQSIEKYYEFLKNSNREKDKARIPLVEEYMKKRKRGQI